MDKQKTETHPNQFGCVVADFARHVFQIELPDKVDPDKAVEVYGAAYQRLSSFDPGMELLQWTYSRLARLKGTLLNRLWHTKPELRKDSLLTLEQWTAFRKQYCKESDDTIENYRNIAHRYPLEDTEADKMGVAEMRDQIRGEKIVNNIGNSKGEGANKGNDDTTNKSPKPFLITELEDRLIDLKSDLMELPDLILEAPDLEDKLEQSDSMLIQAEGLLEELNLPKMETAIRSALAKARKIVQKAKEERVTLQRRSA